MGWLFMTRAGMGAYTTPKAYLDAQFTYDHEATADAPRRKCRVIKSVYSASTYYAAIEPYDENGEPVCVTAAICLVRWNPKASDDMIFGYKDMGETSGPVEAACPRSVLELLSPTDHPWALDWRRRCYRLLHLTERKIDDGDLIKFPSALGFTDGSKHQDFRVRKEGRKTVLTLPDGRGRYRISRLMEKPFEIIRQPRVAKTYFPSAS